MKWLTGFINLVFVSVVAGVIVFVLQNYYEKRQTTEGLTATALTGPWAPAASDETNQVDLSNRMAFADDPNSLARIVITNKGPNTVEKGKIRFTDSRFPEAMIIDRSKKIGKYLGEKPEIELPKLAPGDEATIFLWDPLGFGWPYFFEEVKIYTELGEIPVSLTTHKTEEGYSDADQETGFFSFLLSYWYIFVGGMGALLFIFSLLADMMWKKYITKLIMDDDFWLSERTRMEKLGKEKFKPDVSNLSVADA